MKKLFLCSLLALTAVSCSQKAPEESNKESNVMLPESNPSTQNEAPAKDEGLILIEGADCLSCQKTDARLVGPSFQEVADRYTEADIDMLSKKIIDGGKGAWGEMPMTPHTGMNNETAQKMVKYILSLKKS